MNSTYSTQIIIIIIIIIGIRSVSASEDVTGTQIVKKRKMQFYGHTNRAGNLATTILQGSVDGKGEEEGPVPHG